MTASSKSLSRDAAPRYNAFIRVGGTRGAACDPSGLAGDGVAGGDWLGEEVLAHEGAGARTVRKPLKRFNVVVGEMRTLLNEL